MEVKDALSLFLDICLKQRTLPQSLETLGIHGDYVGKVGMLQRNLFYDAIKRYAKPVSDTVRLVCSTYFEATIRDCNSKVSAREMSKRFAQFMTECLALPVDTASAFVIPLGATGKDAERIKDGLHFCFNEIFDNLKDRGTFDIEPIAGEIADFAQRLDEQRCCKLDNSASLYINKFRKRLHLENAHEVGASLESIYVEPEYVHCTSPTEEKNVDAPLRKVVEAFVNNEAERFDCLDNEARVITLLGQPGVGKTSFLQFLVSEHARGRFCPKLSSVYCIPLCELASSEFSAARRPLKFIRDALGLAERDLDDTLLILDGLDELCLVLSAGTSINDFYLSLIRDADSYNNCHILVTSRLNYVSAILSPANPTTVFELKEFSWANAEKMIDNIAAARKKDVSEEVKQSLMLRFKDSPFLTVPLLLYTVIALEIDVSDIDETGQLYDRIFAEMTDRTYGVVGRQKFSDAADPRELARALASEMRCRGRKYLDSFEAKAALSKIDASLPEGEAREAIEKSYGLTFFYEKRHPELFAPEFLHLTFVEFLAAEQIYLTLVRAIEMNEVSDFDEGLVFWWEQMDYLFAGAYLSAQVVAFFRYKVESNQDRLPKESLLSTMLEWLFSSYLGKGMVYSAGSEDMENCVEKASRLFVSYWRLMKCLYPDDSIMSMIDPIERTDFFHFLRVASRYSETPLSFTNENLSLCDLRDLDFSYCDLSGADLSQSNLSYSRFRESMLIDTDFLCSCLDMVDFTGAHMRGARIAYTCYETARFDDIDPYSGPEPDDIYCEMMRKYDTGVDLPSEPEHFKIDTFPHGPFSIDSRQHASGKFHGLYYVVVDPEDEEEHADLIAKMETAQEFWEE